MVVEETASVLLESCVCGGCVGCPDGWHVDVADCGCTADCALEDDES